MDWWTFADSREVCKSWYEAGKYCQPQWYWWLCARGPKARWELQGHVNRFCKIENCHNRFHYRHATRVAVPLKTVPLYEQVLSIGIHRMHQRRTRRRDLLHELILARQRQLNHALIRHQDAIEDARDSQRDKEWIEAKLKKRKRKRVEIDWESIDKHVVYPTL